MNHGRVSREIAKGLKVLRARIDREKIPASKLDESLNIATWNIREFGKQRRSDAAIHYIAEVLNQFDVIGVVELRDDLRDLYRVLEILGPYWQAVFSDVITDHGGNDERIAYVYDKRMVVFNGLAAEANPPRTKKGTEYLADITWWRSPYMASFRAGNFDFVVLTVHIRWGKTVAARAKAIEVLADWIEAKRTETHAEDKDMIVMGDFNIPSTRSSTYRAITKHGLMVPKPLAKGAFGTNLEKKKRYDQILHHPIYSDEFTNHGGVLDFYAGNHKALFPNLTKEKFTYQMSDHLPLWIQVKTDLDDHRLDQIIQG